MTVTSSISIQKIPKEIKRFQIFFLLFVIILTLLLWGLWGAKVSKFQGREFWVLGYYLSFSSLLLSSFFGSSKNYPNKGGFSIRNLILQKPMINFWWKVEDTLKLLWIVGFILIFLSEFNYL